MTKFTERNDWTDWNGSGPAPESVRRIRAADLLRYERGIGDALGDRVGRQSVMALGDSLVGLGVAPYLASAGVDSHRGDRGGHGPADWLFQANLLADSRMDVLGGAATPGFTIEQIRDTHLPTVLAARPTYCVCWSMGANNALQAGQFPKSMLEVSTSVLDALLAEGITPIMLTLPPVAGSGDLSWDETDRYNSWVAYTAQRRGFPFIDAHALLVNSATGAYRDGLSDDGLHPNGAGSAIVARALADLFVTQLDRTGPRALLLDVNLLEGGSTGTAPNAHLAGAPDAWSLQGPAPTLAAQPNGGPGRQMTLTRSGGQNAMAFGPVLPANPGDVWTFATRLGATPGATGTWTASLLTSDGTVIAAAFDQRLAVADTRILSWRGVIPAGATSVRAFFQAGGADGSALRVAQVTLRNLSAKGIPL